MIDLPDPLNLRLFKPVEVSDKICTARDGIRLIDLSYPLLHIRVCSAEYLFTQGVDLICVGIIVRDTCQLLNNRRIGFLSLVLQTYFSEMEQYDLHRTGVCKNNYFIGCGKFSPMEGIELLFQLLILRMRGFVRVAEYQNDLVTVIVVCVLVTGKNI